LLDAATANGLEFSKLSQKTHARLARLLSVGTIIGNPLDSGFAALTSQDAYLNCVEILLDDPGIDVLLLQEELPRGPGTERKEANLRAVEAIAARVNKPIAFTTMISHGLTDYSRTLRAELPHLAFLQEVDKSVAAVRAVIDYAERKAISAVVGRPETNPKLEKVLARGSKTLSETESKALLKLYGIGAPRESVATSEKEAAALAKKLGFPVVAKATGMAHKSDAGGVMLNLQSAGDVRAAYKRLSRLGDGVLIAEQVSGGLELVIGLHRDPEMGPVILFGAGGVDLELNRDVAFAGVPLDQRAAEALIARTRVAKRIAGYRGAHSYDRKALVKALMGLSQLALDASARLQSVDVNPFLLRRRGGLALDALVVLNPLSP
jgi:acetyltransferase